MLSRTADHTETSMDFSIVAFILVSLSFFQRINGYSEKAEEAIKKLIECEIEFPDVKTIEGAKGSSKVVPNSVPGLNAFWSDKLIQTANQANQVRTITIPEFQARVANFDNIVKRIEDQNIIKINDGRTKFDIAAIPAKTAIEMVSVLKKVPFENFTTDIVRELVQSGVDVLLLVKPDIIINNSAVIANVRAAVLQVIKDLDEFTPAIIKRKCFPNVVCVANLLLDLKASVKKAQGTILLGEAVILETSFKLDRIMNIKIPEEEERIRKHAGDWATWLLKTYSVDKQVISDYYLGIIVQQNPSSAAVQAIVKQALSFVAELSYYNDLGKNESRNTVYSSGYPVIDAYNTVYYLIRNKNGSVLGNEINEVNAMLNQIYNEIGQITPNFTAEINAFYEEIKNLNTSITASATEYLEKEMNETFVGDLVEYFLLYSSAAYDFIPLGPAVEEAKAKLDAITKKIQTKIPGIQAAFDKLQNTLNARVQKLHVEVLYDIANRLYKGGSVTHADIYWFGSLNLNNTFKYWKPLITAENINVEKTYKAIVDKNYGSYSIRDALINITAPVLQALAKYENVFGAALVKKRSTAVVTYLVDIPAADYLSIVKYNSENITQLYNSKESYLAEVPLLEADRESFLKQGIQTFPDAIAPYVEQSHYHNLKVYRSKVALNNIQKYLIDIRAKMLASEGGIVAAGPSILERIQRIANEYIIILNKYAKLKTDGEQFVAELPTINIVASRILREIFGFQQDDIPDFSENIVRTDLR